MTEHAPVALVTGAALRLGAAIAKRLHNDGFRVLVHYRRSRAPAEALVRTLNGRQADSAALVAGDLADATVPEALAADTLAAFGRCDLLVNNASSFYPTAIGAVGAADWDELVGSNLRGPFFLAQALAPALADQDGSIVNIADIHASRPLRGYAVYSIAKAGLVMMTQALARELAPAVRVNAVAPGAILWPEDESSDWSRQRQQVEANIPLQRTGAPEDIADAVAYLAQARYVSGQVLAVDGGRSVVI